MRATTAFNKMLAIPGADVTGVQFTPAGIRGLVAPPVAAAVLPVRLVHPGGL